MLRNVITIFGALFISSLTLKAQNQIEIPHEVKLNFMEDFISASTIEWTADERGDYKADFVHQSEPKTAFYTKDGMWLRTETKLQSTQVPAQVLQSLSRDYKTYDIDQVTKLEMKLGVSFHFRIRIKDSVFDVEIDSSGKIKSKRKRDEVEGKEAEEAHEPEEREEERHNGKKNKKNKKDKSKKKHKHKEHKNKEDYQ
jgi:hypothetical protein